MYRNKILFNFIIVSFLFLTNYSHLFSQHGFLSIKYEKPGLKVLLNDSIIGFTPLNYVKIDTGKYSIQIQNPQQGIWSSKDWVDEVYIKQLDSTTITPIFSKSLSISSEPFDAQIFLNNQYLGTTPLHHNFPASTTGDLILKKEFYNPYVVNFDTLHSNYLKCDLVPIADQLENYLQLQDQKYRKHKRYKTLSYTMMALTLCTGFTTAYLRDKAEKNDEKYRNAGDPIEMDHYFNETKKYDNYSNVSLGVFEVSFTLTFYFLFKTAAR